MTVLIKKRNREEDGEVEALAMANSLALLSRNGATGGRVFTCKTCNRLFPSFQALGGHRASHKKPRLLTAAADGDFLHVPEKPKVHECSICGLEFSIGQALGGHMRKHRPDLEKSVGSSEERERHMRKQRPASDDGKSVGQPGLEKSVGMSGKRDKLLDLALTLAPMWLIA